jgi:hypothetical protein
MQTENSPQITKQLKAFLANEQLSDAELARSLKRIVKKVAADEGLLAELQGHEQTPTSPATPSLSLEQWQREFHEFVARQRPQSSEVDLRRERMYFEE